ncbi:hypothetical protein HZA56_03830 [Candidatus Poribacteria bacterium]|nr:hypothetical protein [Candidatus Poribacteria bacterium]
MASDFKHCSCGVSWADRDSFLVDPDVRPIGLTFLTPESFLDTYYFFNHAACGTTLATSVSEFVDLIQEPLPFFLLAGTKDCPGHCTSIDDLEACFNECRNAPFRRFLFNQLLKKKN